MKILNSKGSFIDPFGIPAATVFLVLALLLIATLCLQLFR